MEAQDRLCAEVELPGRRQDREADRNVLGARAQRACAKTSGASARAGDFSPWACRDANVLGKDAGRAAKGLGARASRRGG
eukprot:1486649-Alexandrium_andersonii.AAC.1